MDIRGMEFVVKYLIMGYTTVAVATNMRKFNTLRAKIATDARNVLHDQLLTTQLRNAEEVIQILCVPKQVKCIVTGDTINDRNGATLILTSGMGDKSIFCMHRRFINDAYRLFIASHFDKHIIQHFHDWCYRQPFYIPGAVDSFIMNKYIEYNNKSNIKALLLQLK